MGYSPHATGQPLAKQLSGLPGRVAENLQVSAPARAARPNQEDFGLEQGCAGKADALPPAGRGGHGALPCASSFQWDESSTSSAHPSTEPLRIRHHLGSICSHPGSISSLLLRRNVHTTASPLFEDVPSCLSRPVPQGDLPSSPLGALVTHLAVLPVTVCQLCTYNSLLASLPPACTPGYSNDCSSATQAR